MRETDDPVPRARSRGQRRQARERRRPAARASSRPCAQASSSARRVSSGKPSRRACTSASSVSGTGSGCVGSMVSPRLPVQARGRRRGYHPRPRAGGAASASRTTRPSRACRIAVQRAGAERPDVQALELYGRREQARARTTVPRLRRRAKRSADGVVRQPPQRERQGARSRKHPATARRRPPPRIDRRSASSCSALRTATASVRTSTGSSARFLR